jgi:hypothetical protein
LISIGSIIRIPIISRIVGGTIVVIIPLRAIVGKMISLITNKASSPCIIISVPGVIIVTIVINLSIHLLKN